MSHLFLPAVASVSMHGGAIPITWPVIGYGRASLFCREEIDFAEGLGDLQSSEGVVSSRSRRLLIHCPWDGRLTLCYVSGDVGEGWRGLGLPDRIGPFWEKLIPSGLFPYDCRVIHVQVSQVLLRQYGVLNNIFTPVFVFGLWSLFLVLWRGVTWRWRYGRRVFGREELIRGVGLGSRKVIGWSVLGQDSWNFNFCKVWPATGSSVKALTSWDLWELQGLISRPDHLRVPSLGQSLLHPAWHWHAFKDEVGGVGVAAWS